MGQYYKPLLIYEDGREQSAYSHDFDNGLKLMEHSWIGNSFVNAVLHKIENNPTRVAWLGDYSNDAVKDGCDLGDGFITSVNDFLTYYNSVWNKSTTVQNIPPETARFELDMEHTGCYLVNVTKQCYIDMEKYVEQNSAVDSCFGPSEAWCVNPLPLLTCIGNGMGGGDYRGDAGKNDIGSWAFDKIYITYLRPGNLKAVEYRFQE